MQREARIRLREVDQVPARVREKIQIARRHLAKIDAAHRRSGSWEHASLDRAIPVRVDTRRRRDGKAVGRKRANDVRHERSPCRERKTVYWKHEEHERRGFIHHARGMRDDDFPSLASRRGWDGNRHGVELKQTVLTESIKRRRVRHGRCI